jgi:GNAT superfamily N-acetyltransferase
MADLEYRHPTPEDIEDIVNLINTSNKDNPLWDIRNPEEFRKTTFEDDDWEANGTWVAVLEGDIIGHGGAKVHKRSLEHGKSEGWIAFWILQDHRGMGIEQELVKRSIGYLRGRNIARAKMYDLMGTEWRSVVLREFGFEDSWHNYIMINKEKNITQPELPHGLNLEELFLKETDEDQLAELMEVINDSFLESDAPNFTPLSLEFLQKWKDTTQSVVRILLGRVDGAVVGECISEIELEYNKFHEVKAGWIESLGVRKEHRKKGIGKALLVDGMKWLQGQGMDTLYIGVDEQNPTALDIYKSAKFEIHQESAIYGLEL